MQPSAGLLAWATAAMSGEEAAYWCKEERVLEVCPAASGPHAPPSGPFSIPQGQRTLVDISQSRCSLRAVRTVTVRDIIGCHFNDGGRARRKDLSFSVIDGTADLVSYE